MKNKKQFIVHIISGDIMYYLNCFFIYSIFGYLMETIIAFLIKANFKSGILTGPWTPVYGIGAVIILFISNYLFKNLHMNRVYETVIMFFIVGVVLSFIEALGGVLIEHFFDITFWDYTNQKYNIGKYISLEMSIIWGIASIIFIYFLHPILNNIIKKIPNWLTIFLILLFLFDSCKTFITKNKK